MNKRKAILAGVGLVAAMLLQVRAQAQDDSNKWAPANIKIDGLATEWPKPLQFYNNDTKLFYTIANNKDTLFIIVSVPDKYSQLKIMKSGLTVSVSPSGKKKGGASVTFPLAAEISAPTDVPKESVERLTEEWRKQTLASVKEIKVDGLTGVTDGNVPVNNQYGIRTAAMLDGAGNLVCEMAAPFSVLGIPAGYDKSIAYHFKVNAISAAERREKEKAIRDKAAKAAQGQGGGPDQADQMNMMMFFSVDFWTKQVLATTPQ
ncbi:hypothetical protein [Chitinophaga solisilvae]|uniref:Uncharacterized protein n=1 Tax=Chitinophaga solisilvae TaxID=1233460 RepID=A0A9Q5GQ67_9BACT|nr:hypothetical protein [Chitinophaga solisilvae]NSL86647.1 hypothetical protein [Chitinophaga solisilvae]